MSAKLTIIIKANGEEEIVYTSCFHDLVTDLEGESYTFKDARYAIIEYCQDYNPFNKLKK